MFIYVPFIDGSEEQTIPIVLTPQELAALVQQQQQLQDIHNQPEEEAAEPEPQHSMPTGTHRHEHAQIKSLSGVLNQAVFPRGPCSR